MVLKSCTFMTVIFALNHLPSEMLLSHVPCTFRKQFKYFNLLAPYILIVSKYYEVSHYPKYSFTELPAMPCLSISLFKEKFIILV